MRIQAFSGAAAQETVLDHAQRYLRMASDFFLWLPIGGLLALVWANAAPETYFRFAHRLTFAINDVGMTLFFALVTQEIVEAVMPGGLLHTWRRWLFPIVAAAGAVAASAAAYTGYVRWQYELALAAGWPAATAIDVAFVYVLVRTLFGRHPATPFALVAAVAANAMGWSFLALRDPTIQVRPEAIGLVFAALAIAAILRRSHVHTVWPYLAIPGAIVWYALYVSALPPALALVPIVPFMAHSARPSALFDESSLSKHWSPTHLEHELKAPVHVVLFLFGLVNAGVLLTGYGTGTWAMLAASLVGKPAGLLAGAGVAVALGLHRPRGLQWRETVVVSLATCGGFATGLYFATAIYPVGPLLGELKLGVIASGVGVVLTLLAAASMRKRTG